jgi:HD-GYP domain-containing protein (c-di-GMP phosphodiesterase class II)
MCDAIRHHHEHYDGSGYPHRLAGSAIPLDARIIAVADAFDAMTSTQNWHGGYPLRWSAEELVRVSGTQLDPRVVGALIAVLESPREQLRARGSLRLAS